LAHGGFDADEFPRLAAPTHLLLGINLETML